jgi:hypothetical protein
MPTPPELDASLSQINALPRNRSVILRLRGNIMHQQDYTSAAGCATLPPRHITAG